MRRALLRSGLALFVSVVGVTASPAFAEDASALIDRGIELREQQRDEEALELFERAHRIEPSPRALAQIGLAEQALGRWVEAEEHLRAALAATGDAWIRSRRDVLSQALDEIGRHVGRLEVRSDVDGAEVHVDGRRVATLPAEPIAVRAGRVELTVTAPGRRAVVRTVEVTGGSLVRETVDLPLDSGSSDSAAGAAGGGAPVLPFVVAGAAAAITIGTGIWWIDRQSEVSLCDEAHCSNRGELATMRDVAAGMTLGLAALAIGAAVVGVLALDRGEEAGGSAGLACGAGPAGAACRLAF